MQGLDLPPQERGKYGFVGLDNQYVALCGVAVSLLCCELAEIPAARAEALHAT